MKPNPITLKNKKFDAIFLKAVMPLRNVLFAVGRGGNPERHLPLLDYLAQNNCNVIAPYFERIESPFPPAEVLSVRINSLLDALDEFSDVDLPTIGIGHSIGATLLLALSGGRLSTFSGESLSVHRETRFRKLVLFTPPTDFLGAPHALDEVQIPMQIWSGTLDRITPPEQLEILKQALANKAKLDCHLIEGAGHFSFMNILPPNVIDTIADREKFLTLLANKVCRYVCGESVGQ